MRRAPPFGPPVGVEFIAGGARRVEPLTFGRGGERNCLATSHSVTFKADQDKVWVAVLKLVTGAGYGIARTD